MVTAKNATKIHGYHQPGNRFFGAPARVPSSFSADIEVSHFCSGTRSCHDRCCCNDHPGLLVWPDEDRVIFHLIAGQSHMEFTVVEGWLHLLGEWRYQL